MNDINQREIPKLSDTLGQTLYSLRLNGLMYANSELTAPWGVEMPPMSGKMMFHIVTKGSCWLGFKNCEPVFLQPGELVLIPKGEGHSIASEQEIERKNFFEIAVNKLSERFEFMSYGGGGEKTHITCGILSFDHIAGQKLISQLPPVIHIKSENNQLPEQLNTLINIMAQEVANASTGGETVVANLADIIVIKAIRYWLEHSNEAQGGWLGALKDPKIGKALAAIHNQPGATWNVERLAEQAGMSRSGFSARFTEIMGMSVKQYLTEWRMQLARMKIMHSSVSLPDLAEDLGYQSEAAFSRAYKRVFGLPPFRQTKNTQTD